MKSYRGKTQVGRDATRTTSRHTTSGAGFITSSSSREGAAVPMMAAHNSFLTSELALIIPNLNADFDPESK